MEKLPRWTEYWPVDDVPDADVNPKGHAEPDLDESLKRFGYTEPVLIDERTGKLLSGHGRKAMVQRARDAGDPLPDGITQGEGGVWMMPVTRGVASKDDEEAAAYLIAANRLTIKGGWQSDPLASMLDELRKGKGLEGTGYTPVDVDDMLATLGPAPPLPDLPAPEHDAFWPTLRFKVSPEMKARYDKVVAAAGLSGNDTEHFAYLVTAAEQLVEA